MAGRSPRAIPNAGNGLSLKCPSMPKTCLGRGEGGLLRIGSRLISPCTMNFELLVQVLLIAAQMCRAIESDRERQRDRETERQRDREAERQRGREAERQRETKDMHTETRGENVLVLCNRLEHAYLTQTQLSETATCEGVLRKVGDQRFQVHSCRQSLLRSAGGSSALKKLRSGFALPSYRT